MFISFTCRSTLDCWTWSRLRRSTVCTLPVHGSYIYELTSHSSTCQSKPFSFQARSSSGQGLFSVFQQTSNCSCWLPIVGVFAVLLGFPERRLPFAG